MHIVMDTKMHIVMDTKMDILMDSTYCSAYYIMHIIMDMAYAHCNRHYTSTLQWTLYLHIVMGC